jgi:hypothetical protein
MTPAAAVHATRRRRELLGQEWLERWRRSDARWPSDVDVEARAAFAERIEASSQFRVAPHAAAQRS